MKKHSFTLLYLFLSLFGHAQTVAKLGGQIQNLSQDSIKIVLQINPITRHSATYIVPVSNGRFQQELSVTEPTFLYVSDGVNYINGLIAPGDSILIFNAAGGGLSSPQFAGKGNEKFYFLNEFIKFELYKKLKEQVSLAKQTRHPFDYVFGFIDSVGTTFFNKLNSLKATMNIDCFKLLEAYIQANIMSDKYSSIGMVYHENIDETLQKRNSELTAQSRTYIQNIFKFDNDLFYSFSYLNSIYNILFMRYDGLKLSNKIGTSLEEKYTYLKQVLPDNLQVPVLSLFLEYDIDKLNQSEDLENIIAHTYLHPKDSVYKEYILKRYENATSFKRGMKAPDFVLVNEKGEKITLATFKGKVVYLDFWYAACGPCHALFKSLKPAKDYFLNNNDVVFLNISIDRQDVWKNSVKKFDILGYHVFTENRESDHPIIKSYKVAGYPTTCLIDRNGNIFMANPSNNPDQLKEQIEGALKAN